jgi:hypothetical protein
MGHAFAATRQLIGWLATATPSISHYFCAGICRQRGLPVVAVLGLRRPRLIVARSVLAAVRRAPRDSRASRGTDRATTWAGCSSRSPDVLSWLPISMRWFSVARRRRAADGRRERRERRVRLASALITVARLAPPLSGGHLMPASALYRGEPLDRRVRRLLESSEDAGGRVPTPWRARAACALALLVSLSSLEDVHNVVELLIHALP